jgi:phospholipid-binding lipoprotein MlaA
MKRWAALLCAAALAGCASVPTSGQPTAGQTADPWESMNRKIYAFNDAVDEAVVRPVAEAYRDVVPELVRTGFTNVLGNIADAWSSANHFLQGEFQFGVEMGFRVITNSFFGLAGLLDPASEMGLTRRSEDFGQTLGRWGVGTGPYVVLPFLGPSTVRDALGFVVDRQVSAAQILGEGNGRYAMAALELINARTNLLATTRLLDQIALDRYSFLRDSYLARRLDQVYNGAPPLQDFEDDFDDEPPAK